MNWKMSRLDILRSLVFLINLRFLVHPLQNLFALCSHRVKRFFKGWAGKSCLFYLIFTLLFRAHALYGVYAYVVDGNGGGLHLIDTELNQLLTTIPMFNSANGVSISPDKRFVYAANNGSVVIVDTASNRVINQIFLNAITQGAVKVAPDGRHLYILGFNTDPYITVFDLKKEIIVARVSLGVHADGGEWIEFTPDGRFAYVTPFNASAGVFRRDTSSYEVADIPIGPGRYSKARRDGFFPRWPYDVRFSFCFW